MRKTKKTVSKEEHDRIVNTLYEELKRKDEWIARIREESAITLRASIRQAEKYTDLIEKNKALVEDNHKKSEIIKELKSQLNKAKLK